MYYNNSKSKVCTKSCIADSSKNNKQFSTLSKKEKNLEQLKKSINDMRYKMYETAGFEKRKSIVITDETVKVSEELDMLITEYYHKNKL